MCPSRDQQWWIHLLMLLRQVPPPHRVRLHLKVRGCRQLRGNRLQNECWNELIRRSVDVSSATQGCIPWWVDGRAAGRPVASRRRKFRKLRESWSWNLVLQRGICCPKQKPLAHGASSSVHQESQKNTEGTWDHYLHISQDTSHYMEAVFSMVRKIYGKRPDDPMVFGCLVNVHEYHSSSSSSSRKRLWHECEICKELFLENNRTAFQWKRKADQWSDRNHRHKPDQFPRIKLVSTSLLHSRAYQHATAKVYVFSDSVFCLGRMGPDPVESWKNQIQWYSENDYFSEWRGTYGLRVANYPRIHDSENPQWDSTDDGKITVWTIELHRQDNLHVNVQRHCMGCKRKWWIMCTQFKDD